MEDLDEILIDINLSIGVTGRVPPIRRLYQSIIVTALVESKSQRHSYSQRSDARKYLMSEQFDEHADMAGWNAEWIRKKLRDKFAWARLLPEAA